METQSGILLTGGEDSKLSIWAAPIHQQGIQNDSVSMEVESPMRKRSSYDGGTSQVTYLFFLKLIAPKLTFITTRTTRGFVQISDKTSVHVCNIKTIKKPANILSTYFSPTNTLAGNYLL